MAQNTKGIQISFNVPEGTEITSESLAKMKALMLEALNEETSRDTRFSMSLSEEERVLCTALLYLS